MKTRTYRSFPWWASILIAILLYCAFSYLAPCIHPASETLARLLAAAPRFAPIVTIPFLLLGATRLYDAGPDKRPGQDSSDDDGNQTQG